jgi:hypothetical protein
MYNNGTTSLGIGGFTILFSHWTKSINNIYVSQIKKTTNAIA